MLGWKRSEPSFAGRLTSFLGLRMVLPRRRFLRFLASGLFWTVTLIVLVSGTGLSAQTLTIINEAGHSTTITAAQIASAPHLTVSTDEHGDPTKFEGVPLSNVLAMAGVQLGDSLRGARMADVLLATATDGYKVAFALAELDPAFAARHIILADKRDGKALDAREGPFRIVAPGDNRPARWIRQVNELRVITAK
jgi:hypothetical protein